MKKIIAALFLMSAAAHAETTTIVELQRIALSENPRIKAMESESIMMKKRIPQSMALEDPRLKLGINNLSARTFSFPRDSITSRDIGTSQITTGKGYAQMIPSFEIGISQMIPLGKLGFRKKIAAGEYEKATVKLRAEKVETLHMLRMNFYELAYARDAVRILEQIKKQFKLVIDSEMAGARSGMGSISNVIKAKIEYNMVDEEIITLTQKRKEFEQRIHYLAGREVNIPADAPPDPDFKDVPVEAVQREIAASNPVLNMLSVDTRISNNEISLKKSEYAPDLDIGFSYMRQAGGARTGMNEIMADMNGLSFLNKTEKMKRDDMVSFMVTFNIPFWFWNKNIPMVQEMEKKHETAKNLYRDRLNDMKSRAAVLVSQLVRWRELHALYRDRLIPQTELSLETNLARYRTGTVEFMPVIDTVRMLLRYKKELVMAKKEYQVAYSELNALMGVEVLQ